MSWRGYSPSTGPQPGTAADGAAADVEPGRLVTGRRRAERRAVVAEAVLQAEPAMIFALLVDITRHTAIDGSGMVVGDTVGPQRLTLGSEFSVQMRQYGLGYRSFSRVVEHQQDRRIAWESMGVWRGHKIVGGQLWRWVLTPSEEGTTVTHSYVWGYARWALLTVWLPGYPSRAERSLRLSLQRLSRLTGE